MGCALTKKVSGAADGDQRIAASAADAQKRADESAKRIADMLAEIERDWEVDAAGKDHMTLDDFYKCIFQLADVHVEGVDGYRYGSLIRIAIEGITTKDGRWIDDAELLRRYDTNHDGVVDFNEFCFLQQKKRSREAKSRSRRSSPANSVVGDDIFGAK